MKIGITGANGFIGSHLKNVLNNSVIFQGNLTELSQVREFVKSCDRIYHLAGKNRADSGEILKNNIISTANILLSMKLENNFPEIVFASSQQTSWNPDSEYGFTKILEEEIIKKAKNWCIFQIPNVYGPGCRPFYNSVVATFCYQLSRGEELTVHNPDVQRDFIFIGDLITELLRPEFNSYKIPKGEKLTVGEIYSFLTDRLGEHKNLKECFDSYRQVDDVSSS
jgi:UDP-2-acetamido-2,6-beta-L-arabino-hexul-4-ose reductase